MPLGPICQSLYYSNKDEHILAKYKYTNTVYVLYCMKRREIENYVQMEETMERK
jgi:hypothetical protein